MAQVVVVVAAAVVVVVVAVAVVVAVTYKTVDTLMCQAFALIILFMIRIFVLL